MALKSWLEHTLYDLAGVHCVERLSPLPEGRHAVKQRREGDFAGCQKSKHPFPDRPVVGKAALQSHSFLHQRIEREAERLRSPTHLGNLTCRTHDLQRSEEHTSE